MSETPSPQMAQPSCVIHHCDPFAVSWVYNYPVKGKIGSIALMAVWEEQALTYYLAMRGKRGAISISFKVRR